MARQHRPARIAGDAIERHARGHAPAMGQRPQFADLRRGERRGQRVRHALQQLGIGGGESIPQRGGGRERGEDARPPVVDGAQVLLEPRRSPEAETGQGRLRGRQLPGRGQVAIDRVGAEGVEQAAIRVQITGERLVGALTLDDVGGGVGRGSQAAAQVLTAGARPCAIDEAPQRPAARRRRDQDVEVVEGRCVNQHGGRSANGTTDSSRSRAGSVAARRELPHVSPARRSITARMVGNP